MISMDRQKFHVKDDFIFMEKRRISKLYAASPAPVGKCFAAYESNSRRTQEMFPMFCGRCLTKKAQNRSSIGMFNSREISLATDTFGQRRPDS